MPREVRSLLCAAKIVCSRAASTGPPGVAVGVGVPDGVGDGDGVWVGVGVGVAVAVAGGRVAAAGAEVAVGCGVEVVEGSARVGSGASVAIETPPALADSLSTPEAPVAGGAADLQPKPRLSARMRSTASRVSGHKAAYVGYVFEAPETVEEGVRGGVAEGG